MSAILSWLFKSVLEFITSKIAAAFALWEKDKADHQKEVDQAAQDMQKTKDLTKDSPAKETDAGIDDSLSHF